MGLDYLISIIGIIIFHPILIFALTPFIRPFRIESIMFTYLIPLIPILTVWDGIMSILRLYTPADLKQIADALGTDYEWESGKVTNKLGLKVSYLIGNPINKGT